MTSPPLSATPGGVTSFHRALPDGRTNSCQKLLCAAAEPPIITTAQVPASVCREVARNAAPAGGAHRAGPSAAGRPEPQPVARTAATVSAMAAGRVLMTA